LHPFAEAEPPVDLDTPPSKSTRDSLPPGTRFSFSDPVAALEEGARPAEPQSLAGVLDYLAGQIPKRISLTDTQVSRSGP